MKLVKDRRGAVQVEYAFLLIVIALPVMAGTVAGGVAMLGKYQTTRAQVVRSTP